MTSGSTGYSTVGCVWVCFFGRTAVTCNPFLPAEDSCFISLNDTLFLKSGMNDKISVTVCEGSLRAVLKKTGNEKMIC